MIIFSVISGIFYTNATVGLIWGVFVGRIIYAFGYRASPKFRAPGFLITFGCTMAMIVLSFIGAFRNLSTKI